MKNLFLVTITVLMASFLVNDSLSAQTAESKIISLNESNFVASTKTGLILVDFYADWCRPCKLMKPVLEEFAGDYSTKMKVAAVNTDFNKTLSGQYSISGIPCLVLLKDGKEVKRIVGYRDKAQLLQELSSWLN